MSLRRSIHRPSHATVVAYLALVLTMTGTAYAATGGTFLLGKANRAGVTTALTNRGKGAALRLNAHNLTTPVLSVGRNHTHIRNLNADYLDGVTASRLQRRVTGTCGPTTSIEAIRRGGAVICGNDTSGLQQRVTGTCTGATAVQSVAGDGTVTCSTGPLFAVVASDGTIARGSSLTSATHVGAVGSGTYTVVFDRDVSACAYVGTIGLTGSAGTPPAGFVGVSRLNANVNGVSVVTYDSSGSAADEPFHLVVVC